MVAQSNTARNYRDMTTMHRDHQDAVLTVEEAAKVLRIGRSAAYIAARSGELPTIRVGRSLRVPRIALDRMLGLGTSEAQAGGPGLREAHGTVRDDADRV